VLLPRITDKTWYTLTKSAVKSRRDRLWAPYIADGNIALVCGAFTLWDCQWLLVPGVNSLLDADPVLISATKHFGDTSVDYAVVLDLGCDSCRVRIVRVRGFVSDQLKAQATVIDHHSGPDDNQDFSPDSRPSNLRGGEKCVFLHLRKSSAVSVICLAKRRKSQKKYFSENAKNRLKKFPWGFPVRGRFWVGRFLAGRPGNFGGW
jgi:hypothetical protein